MDHARYPIDGILTAFLKCALSMLCTGALQDFNIVFKKYIICHHLDKMVTEGGFTNENYSFIRVIGVVNFDDSGITRSCSE